MYMLYDIIIYYNAFLSIILSRIENKIFFFNGKPLRAFTQRLLATACRIFLIRIFIAKSFNN